MSDIGRDLLRLMLFFVALAALGGASIVGALWWLS